jgi:hypothetical protein
MTAGCADSKNTNSRARVNTNRRGNCYNNAAIESFWATFKLEVVYRTRFATRAEACAQIFDYIETFYHLHPFQTRPSKYRNWVHIFNIQHLLGVVGADVERWEGPCPFSSIARIV